MTFEQIYPLLPLDGWLSEPEARLLWESAQRTQGPILEVGCYYGRSSCLLASLQRPLYCVDPFANFNTDDPSGNKIEAGWRANLEKFAEKFSMNFSHVSLFRQRVEDWTPQPVGLAYLDGAHDYIGTRAQGRVAKRCGAKIIAAHDVNDDGEGALVRDALVRLLGPWQVRVERLAVWEVAK